MKKSFISNALKSFGSAIFISTVAVFPLLPISCKMTDEGLELKIEEEKDTVPPSLVSFDVLSSTSMKVAFSETVEFEDVSCIESNNENSSIEIENVIFNEEHSTAEILLNESTKIGNNYTLKLVAVDSNGNSYDFSQEFIGLNSNPAKLIITEIRNDKNIVSNTDKSVNLDKTVGEFIEFYTLKDGNLGGLRVDFGYHSKSYDFPAIDVKKGEIIVLHLRRFGTEEQGFIDELEEDLTISTAKDSSTARDLWWKEINENVLAKKDVIALVDTAKNIAVDGIMTGDGNMVSYSRNNQKNLAKLLYTSGVWVEGETAKYSFDCNNISYAHSIVRKNINDLIGEYSFTLPDVICSFSSDWEITATKSTTVGTL